MVLVTMEILQLLDTVIDVPVAQVAQFSLRRGCFSRSRLLSDQEIPQLFGTVIVFVRRPGVQVQQIPRAVCEKSVEIPQLRLVVFLLGPCCCVPVVCDGGCLVVQSAENFEGLAVAVL